MKAGLALLVLPLLVTAASADERLPPQGSVLISGDFVVSLQRYSASGDSSDLTIVQVAPALDYLVGPGLTIGAQLGWAHISAGAGSFSNSADAYEALGRVGYLAEIGPGVLVWPRAGLGYEHGYADITPLAGSTSEIDRLVLQVTLPLLYSPLPHLYLGIGPTFQTDLVASSSSANTSRVTAFGAQS